MSYEALSFSVITAGSLSPGRVALVLVLRQDGRAEDSRSETLSRNKPS